jgi:molybdate transport system substrate-binding protein
MRSSFLAAATIAVVASTGACGHKQQAHRQVHIAAAADLEKAFREIGPAFEQKTGIEPVFTFGSTGLLTRQIKQGAPYDLLAAANVSYARSLVAAGVCDGATQKMYARGRLVVWTPKGIEPPAALEDLTDPRFAKIAIANPAHAPYGVAARAALQSAGLWGELEKRMVYGENVQQTLQFAQSGNADAAVVALSLSLVTDGGKALPVDPSLHDPIDQAMVVCKHGGDADGGRQFEDYVLSPEGHEIMTRYGFTLPGGDGHPSKASAAPPSPIPETEARGLIDTWLAAQRHGNLAAYSALYAGQFTAIRRAGFRTWHFSRNAWLADRGARLAHPIKVGAEGVSVRIAGPVAVVDLVRTVSSGARHERAAEQLLIVRTPDGLRIGREEVVAAPPAAADHAPHLGFVVDTGTGRYAVLAEDTRVPGNGQLSTISGDGPMWVTEAVTAATAPPAAAAWRGKAVRVYGPTGSCPGTLGELARITVATPHAAVIQEWDGQTGGAPLSASARARALTRLAPAELGARLEDACGGAWVDLAGGKAGVVYAAAPAPAALARAGEAALRALPGFAAIQRAYAHDFDGKGPWTGAQGGKVAARLFAAPGGGTRYLAVRARAGTGCGDFEGALAALWRVDAAGKLTPVGAPGDAPFPRAITDVDRDGAVELLTATDVVVPTGAGFARAAHLALNEQDCPC